MAQRVIIFAGTPVDPVPITVNDPLPVISTLPLDVNIIGGTVDIDPLDLSTLAQETTITAVAASTANLNVALSTRATEATLATRLSEATFTTRTPVVGQALMASSSPVVIASNQSAIPASQSGSWSVAQSGVWTVGVSGTVAINNFPATQPVSAVSLPLPAGAATEATLALRLTESTFTTRTPVVGQAAMTASSPVVIASNQSSIPTNKAASYIHLNAAGTTVIKASPGVLHKVTINDFGGGTMTFYDNTAGSGTVIAAIKPAGNTGTLFYELSFTIGLTAVIVGAAPGDATITYD